MPDLPFRTRLSVLFAAPARKAVLLRRGPKTHYCLIAWDLKDDSFRIGQWMKGHVHLCDLSPDGRTLIYWAAQYRASAEARRRQPVPFDPPQQSRDALKKRRARPGRKVPRYLRPLAPDITPRENTGTWTAQRAKAMASAEGASQATSMAKIAQTRVMKLSAEIALDIIGADGMVREEHGVEDGRYVDAFTFAPASSIYGGTD